MGRPPCCDKVGVKKGPWTPEEDIMLVTYLQEHGPGNWRAVPTNTGLRRCSKSCRLRWANYLRPGIKRGSFTDDEEKLIIQLQALLGNKWAAIASYLPERTDNDIKNFWNTHLKKKLNSINFPTSSSNYKNSNEFSASKSISKGQWERKLQQGDINTAKQALNEALSLDNKLHVQIQTTTYASSTENIARLLKGWMKNPKSVNSRSSSSTKQSLYNNNVRLTDSTSEEESVDQTKSNGLDLSEAYENIFGFESLDSSSSETASPNASIFHGDNINGDVPNLSMVENWLLEDSDINGKDDLTTNFSCFYEDVNLF